MEILEFREVTSGLQFPEGPVAMGDGSVVLVEMFAQRITRVRPDGSKELVAHVAGGPNGAALGPDGMLYVCNNGGAFAPVRVGDLLLPGPFDPQAYIGGRIQRVDMTTGEVTDLYTECDGRPLRAPNDLVFDGHGGFWFTDHGIRDQHARLADISSIFYASADGSSISEQVHPTDSPNGIGLSPDGATLYWAETRTGRVLKRDIGAPGVALRASSIDGASVVAGLPGLQMLDSLAVDGDGNICVATLINGGITVISPDGARVEHVAVDDRITTNICFGDHDGSGEFRDAYVTAAGTGRLLHATWPRAGLQLAHH